MRELIRFLRDNDLRTILAALHSRDVNPLGIPDTPVAR